MKNGVTALSLGQDILTRLDAIAAADGRSRSNQARIFLEAAMRADAALRRQAESHFQTLQMPGGGVFPHAAGGSRAFSSSPEDHQAERATCHRTELRQGGAGDSLAINCHPASPSDFLERNATLEKPAPRPPIDPHAELKADAIRDACAGIISRIQPKKGKQE